MNGSGIAIAQCARVNPVQAEPELNWYAIQTRSRHERVVERQLQGKGIDVFYPAVTQIHRWSDRRKLVECPLFAGYAFVRIAPSPEERVKVLQTHGVVQFVGGHGQGAPIPAEQMEAVQAVATSNLPFIKHAFLKVGQRVRVRGGSLDGVEGILTAQNGSRALVISVEPIQRSLSISIEGYEVEPV
ncbi:MAG: UpxY family transcription antiterminator [Candidatus Sulfotelmatobacter sp.]|jgi:transcription antitermination factor NusG